MIDKAFLEGIGVTDAEAVKQITETYNADIKSGTDAVATIQAQLDTANQTIQSYKDMDIDGIKASVEDYKQKLEKSEADREAFEYNTQLDKFVQKQGMKNDIYAAHLKQQLVDKQLKFDGNGTLLGGDDIVKALRESCPDAFADSKPKPEFVDPTPGSPAPADEDMIKKVMGLK